jgi:hypothetical protein
MKDDALAQAWLAADVLHRSDRDTAALRAEFAHVTERLVS